MIELKSGAGSAGLPSEEEEIVGSADCLNFTLLQSIVKLGLPRRGAQTMTHRLSFVSLSQGQI